MRALFPKLLALLIFSVLSQPLPAQIPQAGLQELRWRMIGPFRGGRTRAAEGVPRQPNVFYVGAVDGGVWKSSDYGRTWNPIFDEQPTQSIGAIAVAPSDPDVIYVASGEGLQRPDLSVGNGIYKSTDGGKTWTHLGLRDSQQIPALAVDPHDPDRLFAAVAGHPYGPNAERGLFRSTDGGATWDKVLYKDVNTGAYDVEIDPLAPNTIYATLWQSRLGPSEDKNSFAGTNGGVFKSTDGGSTWRKLTQGLPQDTVQVNLALAASNHNRLFAVVSTTKPTTYATDEGMGFFRSDDAGETWTRITDDPRPAMKIGGGDLPVVRVDPKDENIVYSTGIVTVRSRDGGKTWNSIRGAPGGDDYQNLWINPDHPEILLLVSDQGAIVSVNGGESWSSWYNQPTAQLFHVITTNSFPYMVCGAQQESGSVCIASRGNDGEITFRDWHPVGVIEYGYVAPDPLDPDLVYGAGRSEVSRYHRSTGQVDNVTPIPIRDGFRVTRTEPLVFSPADPHLLFYAANAVFATRDGGHSWKQISQDLARKDPGIPASVGDQASLNPDGAKQRGSVYALAPSFKDVNSIWAGTDDGLVWIARDGGKTWKNITPPELTPWSKVTQISLSRFDEQTAYVSVSRFRLDDMRPYIYRTHDSGQTWQKITEGLDDAPVNTVRADAVRKGLLFCGTENAVWVSFDEGDHWQPLQQNLPRTSMRDLWIHGNDLIVATHGRSFWILDDISVLRNLNEAVLKEPAYLFPPAPAFRVRRSTNTDTPLPADEPAGENPPDGAVIDYNVAEATSGSVTLEVLDAKGTLVRRYSNADQSERSPDELRREMIPAYWLEPFRALPGSPGFHRWVWDLHYSAPVSSQHEYPISAVPHRTPRYPLGPLALPGEYRVRLTINGKVFTQPLTLKMDPRVKVSPEQLREKFDLEMQLAGAIWNSSTAVLRAQSIREQLQDREAKAQDPARAAIHQIESQIAVLLEGEKSDTPTPALLDVNQNCLDLYKEAQRGDGRATEAQQAAAAKTGQQLDPLLKKWDDLQRTLPALNQQLKAAALEPVDPGRPPRRPEPGENDE